MKRGRKKFVEIQVRNEYPKVGQKWQNRQGQEFIVRSVTAQSVVVTGNGINFKNDKNEKFEFEFSKFLLTHKRVNIPDRRGVVYNTQKLLSNLKDSSITYQF